MPDKPENLVLTLVRETRADVAAHRAETRADATELRSTIASLEQQ